MSSRSKKSLESPRRWARRSSGTHTHFRRWCAARAETTLFDSEVASKRDPVPQSQPVPGGWYLNNGCSKLCRIEQSFKLGGQRAPYSPATPSDMAFVQPLGSWSRQASNHLVLRFSTSVAESMEVQHLNEMGPIRKPATCQLFRKRFGDCQSVFGGSTFTPEPHSGNSPKSNYQRAIDGLQFSTQDDGGSMAH
jgi:hypothetical protein